MHTPTINQVIFVCVCFFLKSFIEYFVNIERKWSKYFLLPETPTSNRLLFISLFFRGTDLTRSKLKKKKRLFVKALLREKF
jgi:hypothetical protein